MQFYSSINPYTKRRFHCETLILSTFSLEHNEFSRIEDSQEFP